MHTDAIVIGESARVFRLITSNDAARLADQLGARLGAPVGDPLVPARVLVPQAGLKRWLQVHLTEKLGVLANVEFTPPAEFAWALLRAHEPGAPERSPLTPAIARWHLYALLDPGNGSLPSRLSTYLEDGDPLRRAALAGELARVFERMQGYRRATLAQWEARRDGDNWMAWAWRALVARAGGHSRAARVEAWLAAFDPERGGHDVPPGLPARLDVFACSNVSPDVLRILAIAGLHCDVDFYLPLPSMEYLGDLPRTRAAVRARLAERNSENPLILSLGGALGEFLDLLFGYQYVQPDIEHDPYDDRIAGDSLLARVRNDILHDAAPMTAGRLAAPDASLQFHACHTPVRELQTLRDALLDLFDDPRFDPPLQPRDVAVMMPDVAAYRPAIEAVFGSVPRTDATYIPYNLGDLGATALHPAAGLLLQLLDAPASRWKINELTDVLETPGVLRRFDLDADAAARLHARLVAAGVRWGEDAAAHVRAGAGDYPEFSWAFAVDRIVAGFAAGDTGRKRIAGTAPLPGVEGETVAQLDAVLAITDIWRRLRAEAERRRPAADWQRLLNECFDALYRPDPADVAEVHAVERVRAAMDQLARDCDAADPQPTLPWPVVRVELMDALAAPDPAQRLFTGGVTFCGMVPLRVVPFRAICLIGMQDGAFPRSETDVLGALSAERQPGDRDVRADDRLLLLQLVAAARDVFYVSWIGQDVRSNKPLPPSAVVAELVRMVKGGYLAPGAGTDELPRREPLHPFSVRLFDGGRPRSHAVEWIPTAGSRMQAAASAPFATASLPAAAPDSAAVALADLKRFFDNPARGYLERGLRMRLPRNAEAEPDVEPLQPDDTLLRYTLTRELLVLDDAAVDEQQQLLRAEGRLPPGALGDAALDIARERSDLLAAEVRKFTGGAAAMAVDGAVELGEGIVLAGRVEGRYANGLLRADPGKLNGRRVLRAWLDALFASARGDAAIGCRILTLDRVKGEPAIVARQLRPIEPADARARLRDLIEHMHRGLGAPLPLLPKLAWDALKCMRQKGRADAHEFARNLADVAGREPGAFGERFELDDDAVAIAWRGFDFTAADRLGAWYEAATAVLPPDDDILGANGGEP
ncbi:MAG TPA: exodeoxyribonuclease V subunit gamma [Rhodanobacteraceae bacterium]|nr:exodeoxyribonuclease V subunit gamma [Rhodanobacteraceae bacterium]